MTLLFIFSVPCCVSIPPPLMWLSFPKLMPNLTNRLMDFLIAPHGGPFFSQIFQINVFSGIYVQYIYSLYTHSYV